MNIPGNFSRRPRSYQLNQAKSYASRPCPPCPPCPEAVICASCIWIFSWTVFCGIQERPPKQEPQFQNLGLGVTFGLQAFGKIRMPAAPAKFAAPKHTQAKSTRTHTPSVASLRGITLSNSVASFSQETIPSTGLLNEISLALRNKAFCYVCLMCLGDGWGAQLKAA